MELTDASEMKTGEEKVPPNTTYTASLGNHLTANVVTSDSQDISTNESLSEEDRLMKHEETTLSKEIKQWDSLLSTYESQAASSKSRLKSVQQNPDNPLQALHGVRRSTYLAPPTFRFSCQEIQSEVDEAVARAERSYHIIVENAKRYKALRRPTSRNTTTLSNDAPYNDEILLQPSQTGDMNMTTFNKSTRSLIHHVKKK